MHTHVSDKTGKGAEIQRENNRSGLMNCIGLGTQAYLSLMYQETIDDDEKMSRCSILQQESSTSKPARTACVESARCEVPTFERWCNSLVNHKSYNEATNNIDEYIFWRSEFGRSNRKWFPNKVLFELFKKKVFISSFCQIQVIAITAFYMQNPSAQKCRKIAALKNIKSPFCLSWY